MIHDYFIPKEEAIIMKELGFEEECFGGYSYYGLSFPSGRGVTTYLTHRHVTLAPIWEQAFAWFRKEHNLSGETQYLLGNHYCYRVNNMKDKRDSCQLFTEFESYEDAQIACLRKLIEMVSNEV